MPRKLKINFFLSTALMILPAIAGFILWNRLPDRVPIHWNAYGEVDGYGSKLFLVAGLPAIFIIIHIITVAVLMVSSKNSGEQSIGGLCLTVWLMPIISVISSAFVYSAALGMSVGDEMLVCPVVCIVFILTGFIMWRYPGLKTINFPTKCLATRSFSGLVMIVCGIVGIVLYAFRLYVFMVPIGVMCVVVPIVYHFTRGRYIG